MKTRILAILTITLFAVSVPAQQRLQLGNNDFDRMGLVFVTVDDTSNRSGNRFPATVINPPSASTVVTGLLGGTVRTRHAEPGKRIAVGESLITLYSPALLDMEQTWLTARSERELAALAYERDQQLSDKGIIAGQRLEQTRNALTRAKTAENTAIEKLIAAGIDTDARGALLTGTTQRGLYTIKADSDGILSHIIHRPGEYVEENEIVATLRHDGNPWLSILVPTRLGTALTAGHELYLADTGEKLILRQRDHETDPGTQTVELLAEFESTAAYLPGQIITVVLPPVDQGVAIPAAAVVHSGDETTVYIRTSEGIEARVLDLVPAGNNYLAREGLHKGEQVVVQGTAVLKGMQLGLGGE